jgi:hypothetical protein
MRNQPAATWRTFPQVAGIAVAMIVVYDRIRRGSARAAAGNSRRWQGLPWLGLVGPHERYLPRDRE